jgi:dsDNA-binding SOS-regulon protein
MNKVTTIKTLTNLKNVENQIVSVIDSKRNANKAEISKYMKKLGLNNQDIRVVLSRNLSVNNSQKEANKILMGKKRLKLTKLLDEKRIPIANRKQFYNKIDQANIESVISDYIKNKSRETTNDITKTLNEYNLKNEDRQSILNEWNRNRNMTLGQAKNQASRRAAEFKKEKETDLRLYMKNELKLNPADTETVMKSFELNSRNMGALRTKAMNLLKLSGEKNRITERIRKAREDNKINLNFKTNITNMENVKKLNNKIDQMYIDKAKKTLARRAIKYNVNISKELTKIKTINDIQKVDKIVDKIIDGKKGKDRKELEKVIKILTKEEQNRILQKFKAQNNTLGNLLQNVQKLKTDIVAEQEKVKKIVRNSVPGVTGQYRRGWEGAINKARTPKELKDIQDLLTKKVLLRNQIEQSNIGEKRGHLFRVMNMKNDVNMRRRIFEKQLKKPIYESNEENNKKFEMKSYNNPTAAPTMRTNPVYVNNNLKTYPIVNKKPIYESNEENNKKFEMKSYNNPTAAPTMRTNPVFQNINKKPTLAQKAKAKSNLSKLPGYNARIEKARTVNALEKIYEEGMQKLKK